jgi:hypothetical protein
MIYTSGRALLATNVRMDNDMTKFTKLGKHMYIKEAGSA